MIRCNNCFQNCIVLSGSTVSNLPMCFNFKVVLAFEYANQIHALCESQNFKLPFQSSFPECLLLFVSLEISYV